jgi:hypothetical protein
VVKPIRVPLPLPAPSENAGAAAAGASAVAEAGAAAPAPRPFKVERRVLTSTYRVGLRADGEREREREREREHSTANEPCQCSHHSVMKLSGNPCSLPPTRTLVLSWQTRSWMPPERVLASVTEASSSCWASLDCSNQLGRGRVHNRHGTYLATSRGVKKRGGWLSCACCLRKMLFSLSTCSMSVPSFSYVCLAPVLVKLSFKCKYDGKQEGVFRTEIR